MSTNRIFRLFISSTFSDFMLEREALQENVFPRLENYCAERGAKFLAIDLRWGITEDAQVSHDTMRICLEEIRRSQELSPKPNFAILLGNRYGWEPIPARVPSGIPVDHWSRLMKSATVDDQHTIMNAYEEFEDTNAIPPVFVLKNRQGSWSDNEVLELQVRDALRRAAKDFKGADRLPYFTSATHQEIVLGALDMADAHDHVHVYTRKIRQLPGTVEARSFIDWDSKINTPVEGAADRLKNLEIELRSVLPGMVRDYTTDWLGFSNKDLIASNHIDQFCEDFYQDQIKLIDRELQAVSVENLYDFRHLAHAKFAKDRSKNFVGRASTLASINKYLHTPPQEEFISPLILHSEGGTGKSAIMSQSCILVQSEIHSKSLSTKVLIRFIGAVPGTESITATLRDLNQDIYHAYGVDIAEISTKPKEVIEQFEKALQLATDQEPLWVFIDAIDQFNATDNPSQLEWLPKKLPPYVRVVISTRNGLFLDAAKVKFPDSLLMVPPMSDAEGIEMLGAWLGSHEDARYNAGIAPSKGRTLNVEQQKSILAQFSLSNKPLWLKLVYEEVRLWHSWTPIRKFPIEIKELVQDLIQRRLLEGEKHSPIFVKQALSYIAGSRFGISEDELARVLGSDEQVREEFSRNEKTDKAWPASRPVLPTILWSRLCFDLNPYLSRTIVDGAELFKFFHREFQEVIEQTYLIGENKQKVHEHLASSFKGFVPEDLNALFTKSDVARTQESSVLRFLMEYPWQLIQAGMHQELKELLTNFGFCMAKASANRCADLVDHYFMYPLNKHDVTEIAAWVSFFQLNSHLLTQGNTAWPSHKILLQLATEHADDSPITIAAETWLDKNCDWTWVRKTIRPKQLKVNPCLHVFEGHSDRVEGVTLISQNIFASYDAKEPLIRIWDKHSGKAVAVLEGHTERIKVLKMIRQDRLLSVSYDKSLRVWDTNTYQCLSEISTKNGLGPLQFLDDGKVFSIQSSPKGEPPRSNVFIFDPNTGEVNSLLSDIETIIFGAMFKSNQQFFLYGDSPEFTLWSYPELKLIRNFQGHTGQISGVKLLSNGKFVSRSADFTCRLWDESSQESLIEFKGHTNHISEVIDLEDGRIVTGSLDKTIRVWSLQTGNCLFVIEDHQKSLNGMRMISGHRLMTWGDGKIIIWSIQNFKRLYDLKAQERMIKDVFELKDGRILSWSNPPNMAGDNSIRIFDLQQPEKNIVLNHNNMIFRVKVLKDGRVISSSSDFSIRIWYPQTGVWDTVYGHSSAAQGFDEFDDGTLLSMSYDHTLRLWDLSELEQINPNTIGNTAQATKLVPIGNHLLASHCSSTPVISIWNEELGALQQSLIGHEKSVERLLLLKNKKLLSCSGDKVGIWDIQSASLLHLLGGHTGSVDAVELRDNQIISFSADGVVKIWNGESYQCQATIKGYVIKGLLELFDGRILLRSKSPDGKSNRLTIWNLQGECEVTMTGHDGIHTNWTKSIYGARQLDDGRILSIGERDFALRLWDAKTGQLLQTFLGHTEELKNVNFLKDGNMVSSSWDKTYRIWDIHTGECLQVLQEGALMLEFNMIELSNNRLLTFAWNKGAKVWDLNTGKQLAELGDGQLNFFGVKLLENGDLLSWDYENQVMIWDMNSYQVKTLVEQGWVDTGKLPSPETLDRIRNNDSRPNYERPYGYGQANFKSQSAWYAQSIQKHLSIINIESADYARWMSDMQSIYMLQINQKGLLSINTSKGFEFLQVHQGANRLFLH